MTKTSSRKLILRPATVAEALGEPRPGLAADVRRQQRKARKAANRAKFRERQQRRGELKRTMRKLWARPELLRGLMPELPRLFGADYSQQSTDSTRHYIIERGQQPVIVVARAPIRFTEAKEIDVTFTFVDDEPKGGEGDG